MYICTWCQLIPLFACSCIPPPSCLLLLQVTTPPPPMLSEEGSDSTCNVVVTLPSPRCKSSSFHASTLTASAATSGSTNTTYSSASEGPTTSNKAVPNSSCSPVVSGMGGG